MRRTGWMQSCSRHLANFAPRASPRTGGSLILSVALMTHVLPARSKCRRVSSPQQIAQQLPPALAHWLNRQTHRRGQIRALLTAPVGETPELDLLIPAAVGNPGELKSW